MSTNAILSIGYNEDGTHFVIYNLDDEEIKRVHVTQLAYVNFHALLEEQAMETIRRDFYPEYQDDASTAGES